MCKYGGNPLTYGETTIYKYIHLTQMTYTTDQVQEEHIIYTNKLGNTREAYLAGMLADLEGEDLALARMRFNPLGRLGGAGSPWLQRQRLADQMRGSWLGG
jgi:hypothetical protein